MITDSYSFVALIDGARDVALPKLSDGCKECTNMAEFSSFDYATFYQKLSSKRLRLLHFQEISSTQVIFQHNVAEILKESAEAIILADIQVKGRGRGSNHWKSCDGCMFTYGFRLAQNPSRKHMFLQYLTAIVVVRTLRTLLALDELYIKWPNDVIAFNKQEQKYSKVCGILATMQSSNETDFYFDGIGLNIARNEQYFSVEEYVTQSDRQLPKRFRECFLASLVNLLQEYIAMFAKNIFPFKEYSDLWLHRYPVFADV
jgi:biotin-(acetyl-CoA carboxylase) ligase